MPFTVGTFMGALVRSFSSAIGWSMSGASQLTIQLVDDPVQNAYFDPPDIGTPVYFQFYGFYFYGLFQKWEQKRDLNGNPIYEVIVVDPREILLGAQIIIGAYTGSVGGVYNLFNAYGFWENIEYGASLANDSGMPWHRIRDAVTMMANTPSYGAYGGPLTFRGVAYSLDLSELPTTPDFYRLGGGASVNLMESIAKVCEDCGCDFFVELQGYTIVVRTISRLTQPPLGTISAIANTNWGNAVVRSYNGLELRNDLTSAFLIGGDVTTLWLTTSLTQFWGYDILGNPLISIPYVEKFLDQKGKVIQNVVCELANLNASPVADIIGSVTYPCTTVEMRCAQANKETWEAYLKSHRPQVAKVIGLNAVFQNMGAAGHAPMRVLAVNDDKDAVKGMAANAVVNDQYVKEMRVYEFVRGMADEYMGKKYLVTLPFILAKEDEETLKVTTSYEIADGGYLPEGAASLGLSELNEDIFKTQDGRFRAFGVFTNLSGADLTKVSPQGAVIENSSLYQEVQVEQRLVLAPGPCAVVTLSAPLVEEATDAIGDMTIGAASLQMNSEQAQPIFERNALPIKVAPAVRHPYTMAIPLKSNTQVYGPWYAAGAPGMVRVEYDPSLTPWNYGDYDVMDLAASCRVLSAITEMQVSEAGSIEMVGAPTTSIGDVLQAGGPNITNIDVQCSKDGGVMTAYRFQTFTPRFGLMSKSMTDRLQRMALSGMELRRSLRSALKEQIGAVQALGDAARTARGWMQNQAKAKKRETPHDCLLAYSAWDDTDSAVRQNVGTTTMEESLVLSNANDDAQYTNTAVMSMNGLFRPFSTNTDYSGNMAKLTTPTVNGVIPNKTQLNPWEERNDIEVYAWGDSYTGLHAYRRGGDFSNARVLGLRAPLMLVGWGFDTDGNCVPGTGKEWDADYAVRQDHWKAGPLDCLWDDRRGVWSVHDALKGTLDQDIPANQVGTMTVAVSVGTSYKLSVYNYFSKKVPSGSKVIVNYIATDNAWYIVAADCTS